MKGFKLSTTTGTRVRARPLFKLWVYTQWHPPWCRLTQDSLAFSQTFVLLYYFVVRKLPLCSSPLFVSFPNHKPPRTAIIIRSNLCCVFLRHVHTCTHTLSRYVRRILHLVHSHFYLLTVALLLPTPCILIRLRTFLWVARLHSLYWSCVH